MIPLGWLGFCCAVTSAGSIVLLAVRDPRRNGLVRAKAGFRRLLFFLVLLPGLMLGIADQWSDFLIWIGATAIFGWTIALVINIRSTKDP